MTTLARYCLPEDILLAAPVNDRQQLFRYAAEHVERVYGLSAEGVCQRLDERECLGSTGLGLGVAIPHARIPGLSHVHVLFVQTAQSIPFNAPDAKPVSKFFIMLMPEHAGKEHLQLLADAARLLGQRDFREPLRTAVSRQDVASLLESYAE